MPRAVYDHNPAFAAIGDSLNVAEQAQIAVVPVQRQRIRTGVLAKLEVADTIGAESGIQDVIAIGVTRMCPRYADAAPLFGARESGSSMSRSCRGSYY